MESFSRRALGLLAAVGAGGATAYVVFSVVGPLLVAALAPETGHGLVELLGALLVGLLFGSLLTGLLALLAGLGAAVLVWRLLDAAGRPRATL